MYAGESTRRRALRLLLGVLRFEGGERNGHRNRRLARIGHPQVGLFLLVEEPVEERVDPGDRVVPALPVERSEPECSADSK